MTVSFTDQFFVIVLDFLSHVVRGCRGHDRTVVGFTATMQTVPITTKLVSSNLAHGEVYSIQHYVIKFVSSSRQIGGFSGFLNH